MLTLPTIGPVAASGKSIGDLENLLKEDLRAIIRKPDVVVSVSEYHSQPVSVLGAVNAPGIVQLQNGKTLYEVLAAAGGLRQDAGTSIKISRPVENGSLPLGGARLTADGRFSVGEVKLNDALQAKTPSDNIIILANDVITVPKADMIYVLGEVEKPGAFVLSDGKSFSVLQALSMAGGLTRTSATRNARILHHRDGAQSAEMAIDLNGMMNGKVPDRMLGATDILYVPGSNFKKIAYKTLETSVTTASGVVIWRSARP